MTLVDRTAGLTFREGGLWVGAIPSRYGAIELILSGTPEAPDAGKIAAIQAFMPRAHQIVEQLRRRLPMPFLWRPVRFAVNQENRVGVQFQRRVLHRQELLLADES